PLDTLKVAFPSRLLEESEEMAFQFFIGEVNGSSDKNLANNVKTIEITRPTKVELPFIEDFENDIIQGSIYNPDQQYGWDVLLAPEVMNTNKALGLTFYDYDNNLGDKDFYFTPVFDLSSTKKPT